MINPDEHRDKIQDLGFTVIDEIYSRDEVQQIIDTIENADSSKPTFRKNAEIFAVRQFLKEVPETTTLIFNSKLKLLIHQLFGEDYFIVKSIYFDKPETSNWFVSYHQDLTISIDKKIEIENYGPWTVKHNQFGVQPPIDILNNIYTIRIHLDDTDENNGALKVIPRSHLKGIYRPETIDWSIETEKFCNVQAGGLMIMKPLILHGSNRTTNDKKRRVVHIEFSNMELSENLIWAEKIEFENTTRFDKFGERE